MIKSFQNKGTVLLITFLIFGTLLILGSYFLTFTLTELRISKSGEIAAQTYYLAEAGINEAIWKLKNDDTTADGDDAWASDFVDCDKNPYPDGTYWEDEFTHFFGDGSYIITIQNSACGRGQIISTAGITLPKGKTAQRIVKTTVFKALGSPIEDSAFFSGGSSENISITFSKLKIDKGNLFSNHNLDISGAGTVVEVYDNSETGEILEGQVLAAGNLSGEELIIDPEAICAKKHCTEQCEGYPPADTGCPPASVSTPLVDFDSDSPYSFKSRAQAAQDLGACRVLCNGASCTSQPDRCIYSASEFEDLLWEVRVGGILTLDNVITYITNGNIELKGGRHLFVNGILLADDNIYIGEKFSWTKGGQKDEGLSQITINQIDPQKPSGLLAQRKIKFGLYSSFEPINITGVIYSGDELRIESVPQTFNVIGAIMGRKLSLGSLWEGLNITLDNDIILYGLGYRVDGEVIEPTFSPIITIEHWEESY